MYRSPSISVGSSPQVVSSISVSVSRACSMSTFNAASVSTFHSMAVHSKRRLGTERAEGDDFEPIADFQMDFQMVIPANQMSTSRSASSGRC